MTTHVVHVIGNHWQGLYVDGECVIQKSRINVADAFVVLKGWTGPFEFETKYVEQEGFFSNNLANLDIE